MAKYKVTLTNGNEKLGMIKNFSVPAGVTCNPDAPCNCDKGGGCYARKGTFLFKNVKECHMNNLKAFNDDSEDFKEQFLNQLPLRGYARVHVGGDFISMDYLKTIIDIIKNAKGVKFLAYTKQYDIINNYVAEGGKIPKNMKVIFSAWNGFELNNPYNFPVSYVKDKKNLDSRIPKKAFLCGSKGKCDTCYYCWDMRKGQAVLFEKH